MYEYDKNAYDEEDGAGSPVRLKESPMVKNEFGELVKAPRMSRFNYVEHVETNSKYMLDWINDVIAQNEVIPKPAPQNTNLEANGKPKVVHHVNSSGEPWRPWSAHHRN